MAVATLSKGMTAFLIGKLQSVLPDLNAALADDVKSSAAPPAFEVAVGEPPVVTRPTLAVSYVSDAPTRLAQANKNRAVTFRIQCLVPQAGDSTPGNFEICRQTASDHVLDLFDDDGQVLTPTINGGSLGTVHALEAERDDLVDIFPRKMEDGKTVVRGWQFLYTATFNLRTR